MVVYICLFILIAFFALVESKRHIYTYVYWLIACLLILLAGLRAGGVSLDYVEYSHLYDNIFDYPILAIEPIFYLIRIISPNVYLLFFFYAILGVLLKFIVIKRLSYFPLFSVLFYYGHFFFLQEMTQIRVGVAVGFVLLMMKNICDQRRCNAIIFYIFAVLSHYSTVICILFFFFDTKSISIGKYVLLLFVGFLICIFKFSILSYLSFFMFGIYEQKLSIYIELLQKGIQDHINIFNISFFLQLFLAVLFLYLSRNRKWTNQYTYLLTKVYFFGIFAYMIFTEIPAFAFRLSEICTATEFILIPNLILVFRPTFLTKVLLVILALLLLILYVFHLKLVGPYYSII